MSIYGGIEAGGTKFVCAVGSGPDDLQDEVRFETTSPKEIINRTIEYLKKQNLKEKLPAIGIGFFGSIELNRAFSNYGFGFQMRCVLLCLQSYHKHSIIRTISTHEANKFIYMN